MEQKFDLTGVLRSLYAWRKAILITCAIAAVGSVVITLLLPNYYEAKTVFLAASPDQAKPEILFGNSSVKADYYGNSDDIDRMLSLSRSKQLVSFMVDSFDLYEHYEIDRESPKAEFKVERKFFKYYDVVKNKRDGIELTFEDTDPFFAADVANSARERINHIAQKLIKSSQENTLRTYEYGLLNKQNLLMQMQDSLRRMRDEFGILNAEAQSEALTTLHAETKAKYARSSRRLQILKKEKSVPRDTLVYLQADVSGLEDELSQLDSALARLNRGLSRVAALEEQYTSITESLGWDLEREKRLNTTASSNILTMLVLEEATPPVEKSRPRRSLLVIGAVFLAFILSVAGVLLIDLYRQVNWKQILDAE